MMVMKVLRYVERLCWAAESQAVLSELSRVYRNQFVVAARRVRREDFAIA